MNDLVSVVIPTYNRYDELFRAIDSVLLQTYKNIEIIVVDDNYNNKYLRNKIKNKLKAYKNVNYLTPNKHLGGSEARNFGVKNSKGKYISFLDDDDEYYENKIEEQVSLFNSLNDDKLALVYCYGDIIYPNGLVEKEKTNYKGWPLSIQMRFNIAGTSFWLIRKDIFELIGGFESIYSHQDGVVLLKLLSYGYKVNLCEKELVKYYFHSRGKGITDVNEKILTSNIEYLEMCKKYFYMIPKSEQRRVLLKYYDDRNWNLIILNKDKEAKEDLKILLKKYFISKELFICIYRIIFANRYRRKDMEFNKNVLLGDNYEK